MCGVVTFFERDREHFQAGTLGKVIDEMTGAIAHRGPDDSHHWVDGDTGLVMGFRRLAILELSEYGRQPMVSPCGRFTITFNGEIYNFRDIRKNLEREAPEALKGIQGHSDTAVLLAAVKAWGFEKALQKLVGMFAIVLWDRKTQELFLARDRAGEKPLYYGWNQGVFFAVSELKSLSKHPRFQKQVCEAAFHDYVHFNYIRTPLSIYEGIYKLPAAAFLRISLKELSEAIPHFDPYSTPKSYWAAPPHHASQVSETEALETFESLLSTTLKDQMFADVPVGAFLSGGMDSSLIVALMRQHSSQKIKTFTIGFDEKTYDESSHARQVATLLETDHHELIATPKMCMDLVPQMAHLFDEPFADSSQIPTYLVAKLAREKVTVSLSGDGGDELFGGYPRYSQTVQMWKQLDRFPQTFRTALATASSWIPSETLSVFSKWLDQNKLQKIHALAKNPDLETLYRLLICNLADPKTLLSNPNSVVRPYLLKDTDLYRSLMYSDFKTYLPDDILVKVDRATMGNSLESRAPFLDHRMIEFAASLPFQEKYLTRKLLEKFFPVGMFDRPKWGFGQPIGYWMRKELRAWSESLLSADALRKTGLWNQATVRSYWESHLEEKANYQYLLWNVIMFQAWAEEWL